MVYVVYDAHFQQYIKIKFNCNDYTYRFIITLVILIILAYKLIY